MTNIGVTGHRNLTNREEVAHGVADALRRIGQSFPAPFTLYSSLAEGTDRLAARLALALWQARLVVPLPLPQEEYLMDFSAESRQNFLDLLARAAKVIQVPPARTREAAYEAAGLFTLDQADVILAVWDGQPARGRGGTGQIVEVARRRGLPLAWVGVDGAEPLTLERFPENGQ